MRFRIRREPILAYRGNGDTESLGGCSVRHSCSQLVNRILELHVCTVLDKGVCTWLY